MAISVTTFERQFIDFAEAIRSGREPLSNGADGYGALEFVLAVYQSCRERRSVLIDAAHLAD
jgi:predicted dehydrogenase